MSEIEVEIEVEYTHRETRRFTFDDSRSVEQFLQVLRRYVNAGRDSNESVSLIRFQLVDTEVENALQAVQDELRKAIELNEP